MSFAICITITSNFIVFQRILTRIYCGYCWRLLPLLQSACHYHRGGPATLFGQPYNFFFFVASYISSSFLRGGKEILSLILLQPNLLQLSYFLTVSNIILKIVHACLKVNQSNE